MRVLLDIFLGTIGWLSVRVFGVRGAVVLAYHSISDEPWIHAVSPKEFVEQLAWLRSAAHVVGLDELEQMRAVFPRTRKAFVAITFDDGYADWVSIAAPALKEKDLPATFFITTTFRSVISEPHPNLGILKPTDVGVLSAQGFDIGGHGHTHTPFNKCSAEQLVIECNESAKILTELSHHTITRMSYPKNRPNDVAVPMMERAGFTAAYAGYGAVRATSSRWKLPRLTITRDIGLIRFRLKLFAALAFARG